MNQYFHMREDLFNKWIDMLLEEADDWKQIGISNDYCNKISIPKCGIGLVHWEDRTFKVLDDKKYAVFLLRYQ